MLQKYRCWLSNTQIANTYILNEWLLGHCGSNSLLTTKDIRKYPGLPSPSFLCFCLAYVAFPSYFPLEEQTVLLNGALRQCPRNEKYCWWTKSCTSWQVVYPIFYRILYIPGGAGFLPSTVVFQQSQCQILFFKHLGKLHWSQGLSKLNSSVKIRSKSSKSIFPDIFDGGPNKHVKTQAFGRRRSCLTKFRLLNTISLHYPKCVQTTNMYVLRETFPRWNMRLLLHIHKSLFLLTYSQALDVWHPFTSFQLEILVNGLASLSIWYPHWNKQFAFGNRPGPKRKLSWWKTSQTTTWDV